MLYVGASAVSWTGNSELARGDIVHTPRSGLDLRPKSHHKQHERVAALDSLRNVRIHNVSVVMNLIGYCIHA